MNATMNVVFMGSFTYPKGMAATKRIQNAINSLRPYSDIEMRVILQRQASSGNVVSGEHQGIPYHTVMGDVLGGRLLVVLPKLISGTVGELARAFRSDRKNVIYFYGPLFVDSIAPLGYARRLGYKIVFDITEDFGLARGVSHSVYHYLRSILAKRLSSGMRDLASGMIVISSYLERECREFGQGQVPVHFMPISVDMDSFPEVPFRMSEQVSLFYAGSFGKKDGLPVLLEAFDRLAGRYRHLQLVLSGVGDDKAMAAFWARAAGSPHRERIKFKGYLEEEDYCALLRSIDIPCMTRADMAFAHAGFPFKLGEFLATGKPVIASRISDVDRFLVNGRSAMVVPPGSSSDVCDAVDFLISNPESAAAIGARGRDVAKSRFDFRHQGDALFRFLQEI